MCVFIVLLHKGHCVSDLLLCVFFVEELSTDSVGDFSGTINLTRTHSVSMGVQWDFENRHQIFYFFTYRPEILADRNVIRRQSSFMHKTR